MPRQTSPHSRKRQKALQAETLEQRLALTGNARLVADISTSPAGVFDGATSLNHNDESFHTGEYFFELDDATIFAASDGLGLELWRTDGTADGTFRISDLARTESARPKYPTVHDGDLYFLNNVGDFSGGSLWKSDGTIEGTERLFAKADPSSIGISDLESTDDGLLLATDVLFDGALSRWNGQDLVALTSHNSKIANITTIDDDTFFTVRDELWVTDGTPNNEIRLANRVFHQNIGDYARHIAMIGEVTYYINTEYVDGETIYSIGRTDGTEDSGEAVAELSSLQYRDPPRLSAHEGKLLITPAVANPNGDAWVYDPTSGVRRPIDETTKRSAHRIDFPAQPNVNFFVDHLGGPSPLWRTDGTEEGTVQLVDSAFAFAPTEQSLLFVRGETDRELWKTDGTVEGTLPIKDLSVGGDKYPRIEANSDGTVYFLGDDGTDAGLELWKSDGTVEGTVLVKDLHTGTSGSYSVVARIHDQVLFRTPSQGQWKHDQQSGETVQLPFDIARTYQFGNELFFLTTHEVWESNGITDELIFESEDSIDTVFVHDGETYVVTRGDAVSLHAVGSGSAVEIGPSAFGWSSVGSTIVYSTLESVWQTTGSDKGTVIISDATIDSARRIGDELVLSIRGPAGSLVPQQLWRTDGTYEGTRQIGQFDASISRAVEFDNRLLFIVRDDDQPWQLWRTDGTYEGTRQIEYFDGDISLFGAVEFGNHVFFFARYEDEPWRLWRTDGTRNGTVPMPGIESSGRGNITSTLDGLYVTHPSESGGQMIWHIGNEFAATPIQEISTNDNADVWVIFSQQSLHADSFFKVSDSHSPWREELWRTDGTAAGTEMLVDMNPNSLPGHQSQIPVRVGDLMYFTADDGTHGMELWQTDGTSQGTKMVQDIRPGEFGSYPTYLTNIDGQLYFSANDGVHGIEPWVLNPVETTIGDTNADGVVDSTDLEVVGLNWQQAAFGPGNGDFNRDGIVDSADLNLLGINWRSDAARGSLARAALADPVAKQSSSNRLAVIEVDGLGESVRERSLRPQISVRLRRSR